MNASSWSARHSDHISASDRGGLGGAYSLDNVVLTAASWTCEVPLLWERKTGATLVLAIAMHAGLGIGRSGPSWPWAREQLNKLGARVCTAAEMQQFRMHPDMRRGLPPCLVVCLDAACQWLLDIGQMEAAERLFEHYESHVRQLSYLSTDRPEHSVLAAAATDARREAAGLGASSAQRHDCEAGGLGTTQNSRCGCKAQHHCWIPAIAVLRV